MGVNDNRRDALEAFIVNGSDTTKDRRFDGIFYAIALTDGWRPDPLITDVSEARWKELPSNISDEIDTHNTPFMNNTQVFYGRLLDPKSPHRWYPWPCKNFLVELIGDDSAPTEGELLQNLTTVRSHTLFLWDSDTQTPRIGDIFRVKLDPDDSDFGFNLDTGQALEFSSKAGMKVMENWVNATSADTPPADYEAGCKSLGGLFDYYEEAAEGDYPCIFRGPDSEHGECIEGQGSREWEFPTVINPMSYTSVSMDITQGVVDLTKKIFGTATADNVAILLTIRATEAGRYGPTAFRFEPHKFLEYYPAGDIPYLPSDLDKTYPSTDKHEQGKRETRGAGRKTSGYIPGNGSHVRVTAFSRAYDQDRVAAIKATSWGAYQVMGEYANLSTNKTIQNALTSDESAQAFLDLFNSDPQTVSDELLAAWFKLPEKKHAKGYALKKDWNRFALEYNGANCCKFTYSSHAQKEASSEQKTFNVLRIDENTGEEVIEVARDELHRSDLVEHPGKHGAYPEKFAINYGKAISVAAASEVSSLVTG